MKFALLKLMEQEEVVVDLERPPVSDTVAGLICPHCGKMESTVQSVYDNEVKPAVGEMPEKISIAICQACSCEYTPVIESRAKAVIHEVFKQRSARSRRLQAMGTLAQLRTKQELLRLLNR